VFANEGEEHFDGVINESGKITDVLKGIIRQTVSNDQRELDHPLTVLMTSLLDSKLLDEDARNGATMASVAKDFGMTEDDIVALCDQERPADGNGAWRYANDDEIRAFLRNYDFLRPVRVVTIYSWE